MMRPSIAICIPSHNCGRYLRETITSVLAQSDPPEEILISDDHSTDDSAAILEEYRDDPRVRIVHQQERLSLGAHYRYLLNNTTSDYVCFLSADDVIFDDFVREMRAAIEPTDRLLVGGCVETDGELRPIRTRGVLKRPRMPSETAFTYFVGANNYTMSFALMHRATLCALPPLPAEIDVVTDYYWALSLARAGTVAFVTTPLGGYRVHATNAGHGNDKWGIAARGLLEWMKPQLDSAQRAQFEQKQQSAAAPKVERPSSGAKTMLKDAFKRVDALRYRSNLTRITRSAKHR